MIKCGQNVPDHNLRTDEGTPLRLTDLKGRALILFFLGENLTSSVKRAIKFINRNISRFLENGCSPFVILGEPVKKLADYRKNNDCSFIMLSDEDLSLHKLFYNKHTGEGAFLVNSQGVVENIIPMLTPGELIQVCLTAAQRTNQKKAFLAKTK